ncbi:uncharacterized protein DNG_05427 [Cephalotrichum gorgonifer]|uniref:Cysteine-rich transmembrane CYSTM domain-containing protein n=1 Tax=Cephalotrichum gorgonifer TaxID=2041049 RepID=A0AAE8MY97_9PEZI|nr:uncharacterized protein DNG_05427 [Cephalotrichum gorgonifer]
MDDRAEQVKKPDEARLAKTKDDGDVDGVGYARNDTIVNQPMPQEPMMAKTQGKTRLRGGGDGGAICCGICAGLCCFECLDCCGCF